MAKAAAEKNGHYILCGECADQVLNKKLISDMEMTVRGKNSLDRAVVFSQNPFIIGFQMILKKSGIMLNSFGLTGIYGDKGKETVC